MSLCVEIQKRLGDFQLDVQFEAHQEPLALLGASGCGKSVTLRCIAGILTPDTGKIVLDGAVLYDSTAHINLPPQRRNVGYLFQQYALFPNMTVRQNIAAAVRNRGRRAAEVTEKLRRFRLEEVADRRPAQLSGGQQQRTALARILASEPGMILLDEPFSALDGYLRQQLELELQELLEPFQGTILWVSHDQGEVFRNCRRVCVISQGRSQPVQTVEDLVLRPETVAAAQLSGCGNFAMAVPRGDAVFLPAWNLTLRCAAPPPPGIDCVGIRARQLHPAVSGEVNAFPCAVVRVIQDLSCTTLLLRPLDATAEAPLLRMELDRESGLADQRELLVSVSPEHLLLLR